MSAAASSAHFWQINTGGDDAHCAAAYDASRQMVVGVFFRGTAHSRF